MLAFPVASRVIMDLVLFQKLHTKLVNFRNQVETPYGMETSGFQESRDESDLKEKYTQTVSRKSSPLSLSFTYCSAQDKGGSSKWDPVKSL